MVKPRRPFSRVSEILDIIANTNQVKRFLFLWLVYLELDLQISARVHLDWVKWMQPYKSHQLSASDQIEKKQSVVSWDKLLLQSYYFKAPQKMLNDSTQNIFE